MILCIVILDMTILAAGVLVLLQDRQSVTKFFARFCAHVIGKIGKGTLQNEMKCESQGLHAADRGQKNSTAFDFGLVHNCTQNKNQEVSNGRSPISTVSKTLTT